MNKNTLSLIRPMILIFVLLNGLFILGKQKLAEWGVDQEVLIAGNLLVFLVCFVAYYISSKALNSPNPQSFVRAMYGSFIIKFFIIAIAAFVYIQVVKKDVNKPALFASLGLYLLYTIFEVAALLKLLKQKKNG